MASKYEYKVLRIGDNELAAGGEKTLNELGNDGWAIVDILDLGQGGRLVIFSRESSQPGNFRGMSR